MHESELIDGRWLLRNLTLRGGRYSADIRDLLTGRIRRRFTSTASRVRAREELVSWIRSTLALSERPPAPFPETFTRYLEGLNVRPVTINTYRYQYVKGLLPALGHLDIRDIHIDDVDRFAEARRARGNSPRTIGHHISLLRRFFKWARIRGLADRDPTEGHRIPSSPSAGQAITYDQARELLRVARTPQILHLDTPRRTWNQTAHPPPDLHDTIAFFLYTGLRARNHREIQWRNVDLGAHLLRFGPKETKTHRAIVIPIHPTLERILLARLARPGDQSPESRLFPAPPARRTLLRALARANCPALRWHDLRHTFGTWMMRLTNHATLQALLGHAPPGITGLYTHVGPEDLHEAIARLPDLTRSPENSSGLSPALC